jgi:hypothetical protein
MNPNGSKLVTIGFQLNTMDPETEKAFAKKANDEKDQFIGDTRNKTLVEEALNERDDNIDDFYGKRDIYAVDALDKKDYAEFKDKLSDEDMKLLNSGKQFYEVSFTNHGGIPMPLIIQFTYMDGTTEVVRIPAEIWKRDELQVSKVFIMDKEVSSLRLDPFLELQSLVYYSHM